jgi:hypothetical protein
MTEQEKLDFVVEHLTAVGDSGGYPFASRWYGDIFVFVNGMRDDDGKWDAICAYRRSDLIDWVDRARVSGIALDDGALHEVEQPTVLETLT